MKKIVMLLSMFVALGVQAQSLKIINLSTKDIVVGSDGAYNFTQCFIFRKGSYKNEIIEANKFAIFDYNENNPDWCNAQQIIGISFDPDFHFAKSNYISYNYKQRINERVNLAWLYSGSNLSFSLSDSESDTIIVRVDASK